MQHEAARRVSLTSQIAEVQRELKMRADVYPRQVAARRMRQAEADLHVAHMRAVLATLKWLQANEDAIRAHIENRECP
jgi:cbb3-type cytochrome oxidase cytochrome c subunit